MKLRAFLAVLSMLMFVTPQAWPVLQPLPVQPYHGTRPGTKVGLIDDIKEFLKGDSKEPKVGEVLFEGAMTDESVAQLIKILDTLQEAKPDKIILYINTPGGSFPASILLSHYIEHMDVKLECIVDGWAVSGGFYFLQSCPVRKATERSLLMAHEPWFPNIEVGTRGNLEHYLQMIDLEAYQYASHSASRTKLTTEQFLKKIHGKDWWMKPDEALKIGAVDEVIPNFNRSLRLQGPPCGPNQSCPLK